MPDSDYTIRRRFRASCTELERAGADEDTAQLVASIVSHLEQRRQVRGSHWSPCWGSSAAT
jgi:hypothetical protein